MKPSLKFALAAGALALALYGCIFSPTKTGGTPQPKAYVAQTAPESVLVNLQISYRRKEIEEYSKLLASDFIFKFQAQDVVDLGLEDEFWTHDEDSTGTRNLFTTPLVSEIRITLDAGPTEPSPVVTHPPGTMKIRIIQTQLEVDQTDGTTWVVNDQQDMFFRRGLVSAGEDTTLWFLMEWQDLDLSGTGAPQPPLDTMSEDAGLTPSTRPSSWGRLLQGAGKSETP